MMTFEAFEARERVHRFLPGLIPSGWQRLSRLVDADDGSKAMGFGGFGISVVVRVYEKRATITVRRGNGPLSTDDIGRVVGGLYRRSKLRHRMRTPTAKKEVAVFVFEE